MKPVVGFQRDGAEYVLQFAYDAELVAAIKSNVPGSMRSWDQTNRTWRVSAVYFDRLRFAVGSRYEWKDLAAHRAQQPPFGRQPATSLQSAFAVLLNELPQGVRRKVKVALLQAVHPDHGGDHETTVALNAALAEVAA